MKVRREKGRGVAASALFLFLQQFGPSLCPTSVVHQARCSLLAGIDVTRIIHDESGTSSRLGEILLRPDPARREGGTTHTASANTAATTKTAAASHKKRLQPSAPGYSAHPLCRATCLHGRFSNPRPVHRASNLAATRYEVRYEVRYDVRYEKLLSKIFGAYWTGLSVHRTS
jgi:hypothetical protein